MLHIPFIVNLILGCVSMAIRDLSQTIQTVAQARGDERRAAKMDAVNDLATAGISLTSAGSILVNGFTPQTAATLVAIALTSYVGTLYWTRYARRTTPQDPVLLDHETRIQGVEREQAAFKQAVRKVVDRNRRVAS